MDKKGFTLVELLAVIVILGLVVVIGATSYIGISNKTKEKMLDSKIDSIESSAIMYGQNHPNELNESCDVSSVHYSFCKTLTVKDLIDSGTLQTEERDSDGNLILRNDVTQKSMNEDTVVIYRKNNSIMASIKDIYSND